MWRSPFRSISILIGQHVLGYARNSTRGAPCGVFQRDYADLLGFELERGVPERISTATGSFLAYGHEVTLVVDDLEWQAIVYFAAPENFPVNVVGRVGFLDRLRVGLVDYEQLLYLAAYDAA